jgi:hypothetical protein
VNACRRQAENLFAGDNKQTDDPDRTKRQPNRGCQQYHTPPEHPDDPGKHELTEVQIKCPAKTKKG